ncbi:MAG: hypothetical protein N4A35_06535 [Flavobacteriales bacterium]|jgi:hypothetical protein|nr:hypothetical protein [Flavobacteriales bacterium]
MRFIFSILLFLKVSLLFGQNTTPVFQPPIPVELMVGNEYTQYKMIVTKQVNNNKLKFFNLLNLEVDHENLETTNFFNQSVLFYDFTANLSGGVGLNYKSFGGAKPVISVLYSKFSKAKGLIIQPTIELTNNGAKELFVLYERVLQNEKSFQPYFRLDAFTAFLKAHDYSFLNWRIGVNRKGLRFGPAINMQYFGNQGDSKYNFGGFIQVLIS